MNKQLLKIKFFLIICFCLIIISGCKKLTEDPDVANAMIGQWRYSQSMVNLNVGGVDLIEYLTLNFDYSNDEAEAVSDSIVSAISTNSSGAIIFNGDGTYQEIFDNQDEKDGSWSVTADGQELNLNFKNEVEVFQILSLTAQTLIVKLPTNIEDIDFDDDGVNETPLEVNVKQTLSKSSNGGAGG